MCLTHAFEFSANVGHATRDHHAAGAGRTCAGFKLSQHTQARCRTFLTGVGSGLKAGQGFSSQHRPLLRRHGDTRHAFARFVLSVAFFRRLEFYWSGHKPA
jgi:hypothetical protein